jgi:hypothetical protein
MFAECLLHMMVVTKAEGKHSLRPQDGWGRLRVDGSLLDFVTSFLWIPFPQPCPLCLLSTLQSHSPPNTKTAAA